jgi:hypothetical protein
MRGSGRVASIGTRAHADHSVQGRYSHQSDVKYLEDAQALTAFLRRADTPARVEQVRQLRDSARHAIAVSSGCKRYRGRAGRPSLFVPFSRDFA